MRIFTINPPNSRSVVSDFKCKVASFLDDLASSSLFERELRALYASLPTKSFQQSQEILVLTDRLVKRGMNCIDIGANKGRVLRYIIDRSISGEIFAIEPIAYLAESLRDNFEMSANLTVYDFALDEAEGEQKFYYSPSKPSWSGFSPREEFLKDAIEISVKTSTLDDLFLGKHKIDFIKIDAEGAEGKILRGGAQMIAESKPLIIVECNSRGAPYLGEDPRNLYHYITEVLEYSIYTIRGAINRGAPITCDQFEMYFYDLTHTDYLLRPR